MKGVLSENYTPGQKLIKKTSCTDITRENERFHLTYIVNVIASSVQSNYSSVVIFNKWKKSNQPIKFSWSPDQDDNLIEIRKIFEL